MGEKTIGIKTWLAGIFPVLSPDPRQVREANLRKRLIEFISMGRVCETATHALYLGDNSCPQVIKWSTQMLESYRLVLMAEFNISDDDLLSPQETMRLLRENGEKK
jgi:hypothetical protein